MGKADEEMTKIRIIVLDGMDWEYCMAHQDQIPNLMKIASEGCYGPLRSTEAPITSSAVCALLSGRDDGVQWVSADRYTTSQELIRTRPWFPELWRNCYSIGLCNVPLTWPAFPLRKGSWLTSGFPVNEMALTDKRRPWHWPASLNVDAYPIKGVVQDAGPGGAKNLEGIWTYEYYITQWFVNRVPRADVEVIWLRGTDSAGHHYWGTDQYTKAVIHADRSVGDLLANTENVIVISDHGFDALDSPRCEAYHRTTHGPSATRAGLVGGHAMEGVIFAKGDMIFTSGLMPEQKLVDVAGGIFDLLQLPPAPGMQTGQPHWSAPYEVDEEEEMREQLRRLGYLS
jgi:hypothetical protein